MSPARALILMPLALAAAPLSAGPDRGSTAAAALVTANGTDAGYARFTAWNGKKTLIVSLHGIAPGDHGLHLHTTGSCTGTNFSGAGGHLNPTGHQHGSLNPAGSHLGDLPNVTADASGKVYAELPITVDDKTLVQAIFDADGTAIVVHASADDYKTDPSGNSGARIACGVVKLNR